MSRFLELVKYQSSVLTDMSTLHLLTQQFASLPLPPPSTFTGKTILITGPTSGLGLWAAQHFLSLKCARLILACRSRPAGEAARLAIETATGRVGVAEVWTVDIADFESVRELVRRLQGLDRLDVVVLNAGVAVPEFHRAKAGGGYELQVAVNVIGTFLLALGCLGKLREGKEKAKGEEGRMVFVASDGHRFAQFKERHNPSIFEAFKDPSTMSDDRYNTTKLLMVLLAREMAARLPLLGQDNENNSNNPIINIVTPGFCKSKIARNMPLMGRLSVGAFLAVIGRPTEAGSRTLVAAACAGADTHGCYMESCKVGEPSSFVMSADGAEVQKRVWGELMGVLEGIEPGITGVVGGSA